MTFRLLIIVIAIAIPHLAQADTIVFRNGSTMDGKVREINDHCIELDLGGRKIVLQKSEFKSIEKNDAAHDPATPAKLPMLVAWDEEMTVSTGLDSATLRDVHRFLSMLRTGSDREKKHALAELGRMNRDHKVTHFLQKSIGDGTGLEQLVYLEALAALDPRRARSTIVEYISIDNAVIRERALTLLGTLSQSTEPLNDSELYLVARTLIDDDADVKRAGLRILTNPAYKAVTPVLLTAIDHGDPKIHALAERAMKTIWETDRPADESPKAYWASVWTSNESGITKAILPDGVSPLPAYVVARADLAH